MTVDFDNVVAGLGLEAGLIHRSLAEAWPATQLALAPVVEPTAEAIALVR